METFKCSQEEEMQNPNPALRVRKRIPADFCAYRGTEEE